MHMTSIDVGRLRANICGFANRMAEGVDVGVSVDNVLGIDGREPETDFAQAFRDVLRVAELRLARSDDGWLVAHDLLLEEAPR